MVNFPLTKLPTRDAKPREKGVTMIMDKGMSLREIEDFLSISGEYADLVKLGWGTSVVTPNLREKIELYRSHNIPVYFGGTLLELFWVRGQVEDYIKVLKEYGMEYAEVSDGSVDMDSQTKTDLIKRLCDEGFKVLSEVGSKHPNKVYPPYIWVEMMNRELEAGSWKVIAEARESGTAGAFLPSGEVRSELIEEILHDLPSHRILWEAPQKNQQAWFIKLLGSDVNLGNIAPNEALPLETLRLGLRSDTFFSFL